MSLWRLEIESERASIGSLDIDRDEVVVGRGQECDLQLADLRVSRKHCRVERRGDELWAVDLGSRRGTQLNRRPLSGPTRLTHGDVLDLSDDSRLIVRLATAPTKEEPRTDPLSGTVYRDARTMLARKTDLSGATTQEELRKHAARLDLLNDVHRALAESPSRDALLDMILDRIFRQLDPEQAAVLLLGPGGAIEHAVTRPPRLAQGELFYSRSLARDIFERRVAALVLDAPTDARFGAAESILHAGVRSVLAAPLLVPDGALGMIVLSSRLRVRQFVEEDLELLVSLASVAALHLRNLSLAEEAAERRRLEQELALARRIQLALLPATLPEVPGYELLGGNVPSRGVSGDLYTASRHAESGALLCFVADVAGKGMGASLLGASLEALAAGPIEVGHEPDELCVRVSRRLYARTPPEKYATAFVAKLDPASHRLAWTNAGHNAALMVRAGGAVERFSATGPPLGLLAAATFTARATQLEPGDLLAVYTDGITEAVDPEDVEFGIERLEAVFTAHAGAPLADVRSAVEDSLDVFVRGVPYADDRTLLLLRRAG
jgi:serine phosphatase RsbU (regulator of sigma subunit)